jgi:hypothetical protein
MKQSLNIKVETEPLYRHMTGAIGRVVGMTDPDSITGERKFILHIVQGPRSAPHKWIGERFIQSGKQLDDLWWAVK